MHYFLSLLLSVATPLLPADIPANEIYLGPGISPIETFKIKQGFVADTDYQVMTVFNFIRLKSALEGSPDLCVFAIDQAIKQCQEGLQREQDIYLNREADDQLIIKSYETRLKSIELELHNAYKSNKILMYTIGAVSLLAASSLTLYVTSK